MNTAPISALIFLISIVNSISTENFQCNLLSNTSDRQICSLNTTKSYIFDFTQSTQFQSISLEQNGQQLVWSNQLQPMNLRWSQLCPSAHLQNEYQQSRFMCMNSAECDLTGQCHIKLIDAVTKNEAILTLIDNVLIESKNDHPKFGDDVKMMNLTIDLSEFEFTDSKILFESTEKFDFYHSKSIRSKNEFQLESHNQNLNPFNIHFDEFEEKLFLKLKPEYIDQLKSNRSLSQFSYKLSLRRPNSLMKDETFLNILIKDNRYDRPVFDQSVYNFTISENSPLNSIIGQVRAIYLMAESDNQIKYRIVPFLDDKSFHEDLSSSSSSIQNLPIKIDQLNGDLIQKVFIDREKYLNENDGSSQGTSVISFNVEASYASYLYDYCKVNIYLTDVNDNSPVARIKPISLFDRPSILNHNQNQSDMNQITNLYINDKTSINQILAYISVFDPDSGENGTIKSIDLTLVNFKLPSQHLIKQRQLKLEQLKSHEKMSNKSMTSSIYESQFSNQNSLPQLPLRLNKISPKLFTLQLIQKLNFKQCESFSIEMRIQDNGTRPQLESKTRINLNILDNNLYKPQFLNTNDKIDLIEQNDYAKNSSIIFKFEAVDLDDDKNGQVKFKIVNNPFLNLLDKNVKDLQIEATGLLESTLKLDRESGELHLLKPINRELLTSDLIELVVQAQDQAEPQTLRKSSNFTLKIKIIDLNNNIPIFTSSNGIKIKHAFDLNSHKQYEKIMSHVNVIDFDAFETNSLKFLAELSNKSQEMLSLDPKILTKNSTYSILNSKLFKFNDFVCYKSLNFELESSNINDDSFPFLFLIERETNDSKMNYVNCKLSLYVDNFKLNKNQTGKVFKFILKVNDFGQQYEHDFEPDTENMLQIEVQIDQRKSLSDMTKLIEIDLLNNTGHFDLNYDFGEKLIMKSCAQLIDNHQFINCSNDEFKLLDSKLSFSDMKQNGVFFVDIYKLNEITNIRELQQLQLSFFNNQMNKNQNIELYEQYNKKIYSLLKNEQNIFINQHDFMIESQKSSIFKSLKNSLSSTLTQFQNLILTDSENTIKTSNRNVNVFDVLLNNNKKSSAFTKFIIITMSLSFIILMLLTCCLLLVIRKNCIKNEMKKDEKLSNFVSQDKKVFKNLNVMDDFMAIETSTIKNQNMKASILDEDETGGFTKFIAQEEKYIRSGHNLADPNEKVTRYLNCLESNYHTGESMTNNSCSPASSSSIIDSKKNLIVPVSFGTNDKKKTTLSTTSSSCISDEGCYGSSDFSSEAEKNPKQQLTQIPLNPNNIMKNQLIISRTQTPILMSANTNNMKSYQSYCLSRFEKIYNNKQNEEVLIESTGSSQVDSSLSPLSSNSNVSTANPNMQIITAISGSYV